MRVRALPTRRRATARAAAGLLAICLVAAGCGGAKESSSGGSDGGSSGGGKTEELGLTAAAGESGLDKAGDPKRGGKIVYGLEADSNGGYCLSEGQLAISGMMIVRAVYDTLTIPNSKGEFVPYLAKEITHNDDYTQWDIKLREGIKFHDGSDLDATVVKNNLDAYRGTYPGRSSLLFAFVLKNIKDTTVVDPLTVRVTTEVPWVAFPSYLYSSSRLGIMAQAQLDSKDACGTKPIGTGPFKFVSWEPNTKLVVEKNPDYWQIAPDGKPYPYLDGIEFRPIPDGQVRNQAVQAGDVDIMHTTNGEDISGDLLKGRDAGKLNMLVSEDMGEIAFVQLNNTTPPFDDIRMRKALAMGADRNQINETINAGLPTVVNGPFAPDSVAYLEDTGMPGVDVAEAKKLVAEYKAEGKDPSFTISATTDPTVKRLAELIQQKAKAVGVDVKIVQMDQAALINAAIAKKYQAMTFRNYPGGDPDSLYVWFYSSNKTADGGSTPNLVNFAGIDDDEVDRLLDEGRSEPDPAKRKQIYQDLEKRMGSQVFDVWAWSQPWAVVEQSHLHGILGPNLPGADASEATADGDADLTPRSGLATGHSLIGLWLDNA